MLWTPALRFLDACGAVAELAVDEDNGAALGWYGWLCWWCWSLLVALLCFPSSVVGRGFRDEEVPERGAS